MTSQPPDAAGPVGASEPAAPSEAVPPASPSSGPLPAARLQEQNAQRPAGPPLAQRRLPSIRPSAAPVELTLDLRATPPDKALSRILGALERVADDVTLVVLLRDTPEYVGVASSAFQLLRSRGYLSDSSRLPGGGQRLTVRRRRDDWRLPPRTVSEPEPQYATPPASDFLEGAERQVAQGTAEREAQAPELEPPQERSAGGPLNGVETAQPAAVDPVRLPPLGGPIEREA